jgi:hypothetical protein
MARAQRARRARDPEKLGDEVLKLGREIDEEIGFRLAGHLLGRGARGHQPVVQVGVTAPQEIDEAAVEADQALAAIKVLEPQAKSERQAVSHAIGVLSAGHVATGQASGQTRNRDYAARSPRRAPETAR